MRTYSDYRRSADRRRTLKVFVAVEDDGEPLLWSTAFQRRTCQAYLDDALSEVADRRIVEATLTLTLTPPKRGRKDKT